MDRWALEFAERAAFICVGCAGSSLALDAELVLRTARAGGGWLEAAGVLGSRAW